MNVLLWEIKMVLRKITLPPNQSQPQNGHPQLQPPKNPMPYPTPK
jgi:hypothetical protein